MIRFAVKDQPIVRTARPDLLAGSGVMITRSGSSSATLVDAISGQHVLNSRHPRRLNANVRSRPMRTRSVEVEPGPDRLRECGFLSRQQKPSWRPSALTGTVTMLSQLTTLS